MRHIVHCCQDRVFSKRLSGILKDLPQSVRVESFEEAAPVFAWLETSKELDLLILDTPVDEEMLEAFTRHPKCQGTRIVLIAPEEEALELEALIEQGVHDWVRPEYSDVMIQTRLRNLLRAPSQMSSNMEQMVFFQASIDAIPAMIMVLDKFQRCLNVNLFMCQVMGLYKDQCVGKTVSEISQLSGLDRTFEQNMVLNMKRPVEESFRDVEGQLRTFLTSTVELSETHPTLSESMVISVDITPRKQIERELRNQGNYFRGIFDNDSNLIYTVNEDGIISLANKAFAAHVGKDLEEVIGSKINILEGVLSKPIEETRQMPNTLCEAYEQHVTHPNTHETLRFQTAQTPIQGLFEGEYETLYVMSNINSLYEQKEAIKSARDEAESASLSKTEFLANMSHELRTPLNVVINFADIMQKQLMGDIGNEKYLDYSKSIYESGVHLLDIINDILDLSKIEAGRMTLNTENVVLPQMMESIMRIINSKIESNNLTLNLNLINEIPAIEADSVKLKQVLINLLSNAVKFTPTGGEITLSIEYLPAPRHIKIMVEDTGIGIRQEDIQRALQRFGQLESHLVRRNQGSGLGLTLAKSFVELHGGHFSLESRVGEGTKVWFLLPETQVQRTTKDAIATA